MAHGRRRRRRGYRQDAERAEAVEYRPPVPRDDPTATVRNTRIRLMGGGVDDPLADMLGEAAGRAIHLGAQDADEAGTLWALYRRFDSADETYMRRIIGRSRFPNVARLEYLPETFETRPDDRPDERSDAERDRDAVNAWMRWQGLLGHIPAAEQVAIKSVSRQTCGELHAGDALTAAGRAFVAALRRLREVEERG